MKSETPLDPKPVRDGIAKGQLGDVGVLVQVPRGDAVQESGLAENADHHPAVERADGHLPWAGLLVRRDPRARDVELLPCPNIGPSRNLRRRASHPFQSRADLGDLGRGAEKKEEKKKI